MKLSEQSLETSKHIETSDKLCANLLLVGLVACRACLLQPDDQRPRCHNPIHNQHHTNHGDRSVSMHGKWALKEGELQNKASKPRDDRLAEDWKRLNNLINSKTEDPWYSSTVDRDHLKAAFDPHGLRIIWTLGVGGIPHQQNGWTKEHMGNQNRTPWQNKSFRLINISPYRVRERNAKKDWRASGDSTLIVIDSDRVNRTLEKGAKKKKRDDMTRGAWRTKGPPKEQNIDP